MSQRSLETTGQVQSLVRALGALEVLSHHSAGLNLTALAGELDLPRSTTHRLLTTMLSLQFVAFDNDTMTWRIGSRAFSVGAAFCGARDLARIGLPVLRSLQSRSNEIVNLAQAEDEHVVFVRQERASGPSPVPFRSGDRAPLHQTAAGRIMMAFWADRRLDAHLRETRLTQRTSGSPLEASDLRTELMAARETGYAIERENAACDVVCVGAPVFDTMGDAVAALSVSAPASRMTADRCRSIGAELRASALKLTHSMGGRVPDSLYSQPVS